MNTATRSPDLHARVLQCISEQAMDFPVENMNDDMELAQHLGLDSLDHVELCMALQDEFDVEFDWAEEKFATVGAAVALVEQKLAAKVQHTV